MRLRLLVDRVRRSLLLLPAAWGAAGAALAAVTLGVDRAAGAGVVPWDVSAQNARPLLATLAGAMVTALVVVFWIRGMLVQLTAGHFASRVLRGYLRDRFEVSVLGFIVGAFAYFVVVLLALPGGGVAAPGLSVTVAVLLAVGVLLAIVASIHNSSRRTEVDRIMHDVADYTVARIHHLFPVRDTGPAESVSAQPPQREGAEVRSDRNGWVLRIDVGSVLAALPEGATVQLHVRVGDFVTVGEPLCTFWGDGGDAPEAALGSAVVMGRVRTIDDDVEYGMRQLVDIATQALSGATDSTTAGSVIVHLRHVLGELLTRDVPALVVAGDGGRRVIKARELLIEDYVAAALNPVRIAGCAHPPTVVTLLETLGSLTRDLHRAGRHERAELIVEQARLLVDGSAAAGPLPEDLELVRRTAVGEGLIREEATAGPGSGA
ncbi:MAG: DUF2254 domain-containing protein [Actinomycetota bacterium]|nr:DUF2254 domain-containing protein [Actinomycetota bacterium]